MLELHDTAANVQINFQIFQIFYIPHCVRGKPNQKKQSACSWDKEKDILELYYTIEYYDSVKEQLSSPSSSILS